MFCRSPEEKKKECLIISLNPTGEIAQQNAFFVVDRMRMLRTLVSPVKEKTTTTAKKTQVLVAKVEHAQSIIPVQL